MQKLTTILLSLALMAGCANLEKQGMHPGSHGKLPGYLVSEQLPDSVALIPAPPTSGSTAFALDEEISRSSIPLRDTPRWELAILDADLSFPAAADSFSCALNTGLSEHETPHLFRLLRRTLSDVSSAISRPKKFYNRPRPFMRNGEPVCTPDYERSMRKSGSYPSGHTAAGWAWALILSEVAPGRADEVLVRGRALGQSRVVCNVHWQSDVDEGRTVAAAVVARLHADPVFRADLELARSELATLNSKGLKPARDCKEEAEALAH